MSKKEKKKSQEKIKGNKQMDKQITDVTGGSAGHVVNHLSGLGTADTSRQVSLVLSL